MTTINLVHLYAKEMSIYGDRGNLISMRDVLQYNGYQVDIYTCNIGDPLPDNADWYFVGGGADKDQYSVIQDLDTKSRQLLDDLESGTPMLAICGGYQLLGGSFVGGDGTIISGLNWFPITTIAPDSSVASRCVGNIVADSHLPGYPGRLVGFENHGGQTHSTNQSFLALGTVLTGYGNNVLDKLEGCIKHNTIGCYLHGPCLAKNPILLQYFGKIITGKDLEIPPEYVILNQTLANRFVNS
jgi:lipid II isoglutaminyl synthase (glutamine-hydrolysing)